MIENNNNIIIKINQGRICYRKNASFEIHRNKILRTIFKERIFQNDFKGF